MVKLVQRSKHIALVILLVLTAIAIAGPPTTAQSAAEPAFIVEVRLDGSATVIVRSTFDLTTDAERQAFESLMDDEEAQQNAKDRFLDRIRAVASGAENATGREMSVTDPAIELRRTEDNETGIVTLSVTWKGLAAVDGDTLVVTEPFASGFTPERPFILRAPDGYEIVAATPTPDASGDGSATWEAGTELEGFRVELQPVETPSPTPTPTVTEQQAGDGQVTETGGQSGFGVLMAVLAILIVAGLAGLRRRGFR